MQRLDTLDYLYWSDTEIRVSATSYVDSEGNSGIGTGKFIVKNKWGDTTMTDTKLLVKYAIENKLAPYADKVFKKRVNLIKGIDGYVFAFNSAIRNTPIRKAVTEKAIRDWACQTGVNFKVFYHDTIHTSNSFISFSNNSTNTTNSIAYTFTSLDPTCFQNATTRHEITATGFEIEMNSDTQWDYDTTGNIASGKFSYYSVLLHELGHAHQLDHILNDNSELMRPSITTGQYRTFIPNLLLATDDVFNYNQNHIYNNCNYSPMIFGNPNCNTNSINENSNESNFTIYPNPFNDEVNIELVNQPSTKTEVTIYSVLGGEIYSSTLFNSTFKLNLDKLSEGIYVITISNANKTSSERIIKVRE